MKILFTVFCFSNSLVHPSGAPRLLEHHRLKPSTDRLSTDPDRFRHQHQVHNLHPFRLQYSLHPLRCHR